MPLDMIAFDADDTLWHGEIHYRDAQDNLKSLLSPWKDPETINQILDEIEMRNLPLYGYGVKAFVLSMIEAAITISKGEIQGEKIAQILSLGRAMLEAEVELRPHVLETLQILSTDHRLMVITKGDLLDQTDKVERSGLAPYFSAVEVVSQKTAPIYQAILERYHLQPAAFMMVGNSLPSDVIPILALGGNAVHIPADTTWTHEMVDDFDTTQRGFWELEDVSQLPALIKSHFPRTGQS
jgi:putative hydrolase of the HAD superfamily